jgi:osmotically-inducible protein OsmY
VLQSRYVLMMALIAVPWALAAEKRASGAGPAAGRAQSAPPGDRELEKAIRERLARSKIGADGFQVQVQGGTATLSGRTDVIQHKGTATRLARSAGARRVVNRIEISEAARQKAASTLSKGRRRVQVKRTEPRSDRK